MTIYLIGCLVAYIENYFAFKYCHEYCWDGHSLLGPCKFGARKGHVIAALIGGIISASLSWISVCCISIVWFIEWLRCR